MTLSVPPTSTVEEFGSLLFTAICTSHFKALAGGLQCSDLLLCLWWLSCCMTLFLALAVSPLTLEHLYTEAFMLGSRCSGPVAVIDSIFNFLWVRATIVTTICFSHNESVTWQWPKSHWFRFFLCRKYVRVHMRAHSLHQWNSQRNDAMGKRLRFS